MAREANLVGQRAGFQQRRVGQQIAALIAVQALAVERCLPDLGELYL